MINLISDERTRSSKGGLRHRDASGNRRLTDIVYLRDRGEEIQIPYLHCDGTGPSSPT